MHTDKCPCINKSDSDNIKSSLITARDIYRHIIKTLSIDAASPEHIVLEEKANKFNTLIYQLDKITCKEEEDRKIKKEKIRHLTSEELAELPLKERIKIAQAVVGAVSK